MKTDHPIYQFLATGAEAFRVLTGGRQLSGAYRFCSLTLKGLERRLDGLFEPEGHEGPVYVIEFQGQAAAGAWYNLLSKVGLYGEAHPHRDVVGICVFLCQRDAPPFPSRAAGVDSPLTGVYLERFLPQWLEREPDNPYVAVFAPLILDDDTVLRARAPQLWQTVRSTELPPAVRETLSQVMEYWFFERFRHLTAQEIGAMLNLVTPIEETRAYQSIFAEGEAKGEAKGEARGRAEGEAKGEARGEARGRAESLKRLLARRFGSLPDWAQARIEAAPVTQLDHWLDGVLDAPSLEALIGPESE